MFAAENLQTHLLNELEFPFNIIGITETKITESDQPDFHPNITGYRFESAPAPLALRGVAMSLKKSRPVLFKPCGLNYNLKGQEALPVV